MVRLGTPRHPDEGLRLGTVRRPPRGVRKEDYASRDFFDVWLPELSPSPELVSAAMSQDFTPARWKTFAAKYRREMKQPAPQHLLAMLAALSKTTSLSVGCYCEDESRSHRSLLRELLAEHGAILRVEI